MKHLKKFNESLSEDRVDSYIKIAKVKYPNLSADEIIDIIEKGNESMRFNSEEEKDLFRTKWNKSDDFQTKPGFVERRMKQQKEYETKYIISLPVPVSAYELLKKNGVPDDKISDAYTQYVKDSLGYTYGMDFDYFSVWCEESDNLVDFQTQKTKFSVLSKDDKEEMMSDAIKMSEDAWMKKYKVGDHGDYLNRAKKKWGIDESKSEKDSWWDVNYQKLIKVCDEIPHEDWKVLIKNKEDFDGVYNSTNKHRALYLLSQYSINELESIINDYIFEDEF